MLQTCNPQSYRKDKYSKETKGLNRSAREYTFYNIWICKSERGKGIRIIEKRKKEIKLKLKMNIGLWFRSVPPPWVRQTRSISNSTERTEKTKWNARKVQLFIEDGHINGPSLGPISCMKNHSSIFFFF